MRREKELTAEQEFNKQFQRDVRATLLSSTFWLDGLSVGFGIFSPRDRSQTNVSLKQFNAVKVSAE